MRALWRGIANQSLSAQLNLELKSPDDELLWDFAALTALCFARDTLYIMLSQTHVHPVAFLESSSQITAFRSEPARPLALKISSCGISWPSPFTPCTLSTWFFLILVRWTFRMFARWTRNPVLSEEWTKRLAEGVVTNLAEVCDITKGRFPEVCLREHWFLGSSLTPAWYYCDVKVIFGVIQGFFCMGPLLSFSPFRSLILLSEVSCPKWGTFKMRLAKP